MILLMTLSPLDNADWTLPISIHYGPTSISQRSKRCSWREFAKPGE
jgi:hypothetical protein